MAGVGLGTNFDNSNLQSVGSTWMPVWHLWDDTSLPEVIASTFWKGQPQTRSHYQHDMRWNYSGRQSIEHPGGSRRAEK